MRVRFLVPLPMLALLVLTRHALRAAAGERGLLAPRELVEGIGGRSLVGQGPVLLRD